MKKQKTEHYSIGSTFFIAMPNEEYKPCCKCLNSCLDRDLFTLVEFQVDNITLTELEKIYSCTVVSDCPLEGQIHEFTESVIGKTKKQVLDEIVSRIKEMY